MGVPDSYFDSLNQTSEAGITYSDLKLVIDLASKGIWLPEVKITDLKSGNLPSWWGKSELFLGNDNANTGGGWFTNTFVGGTVTVQNGIEGGIESDLGDKYRLATYHTITKGSEKLFNVNTTTFINQKGVASTTVDYSLNLSFYKLKVNLTDIGIEQEIGIGPYILSSFGLSVASSFSSSGEIGSYGVQGSVRSGGYTLGGQQ